MSDLFWPGADRAGDTFTDRDLLDSMIDVEAAWLDARGLGREGEGLHGLIGESELEWLATEAEAGGNPVIGLVGLLRDGLGDTPTARVLHRGLTSQDVVDTALVLMLRDAVDQVRAELVAQVAALTDLATAHRETAMVARTLTQHAVPTTFGLKAATWLSGILDAHDDLAALSFPLQFGGAAGTLAAVVELGLDPVQARADFAGTLGLAPAVPWHTNRRPLTRAADALVACTDAWGRLANDVLALARPEIGELAEKMAGGSSTMPHKQNPVLSVLVRRAALSAPHLAATLHAAAADQVDERALGGWHAEWGTLRSLVRQTLVAASQTSELLARLEVRPDRMRATLSAAYDDLHSEQRSMAALAGHQPSGDYLGAAHQIIDEVLARAAGVLAEGER